MKFDQRFIDNYIRNRGAIKQGELEMFEEQMQNDRTLAEEVRVQKEIMLSINQVFDQELKQKLKEANFSSTKKLITLNQVYAIAASLTLLLVFGYVFLKPSKTAEQIYLSYYQSYPNIIDPKERGKSQKNENAYSLYEQKNYKAAIGEFKNLIENDSKNAAHYFYLGISAMELTDYPLAENCMLKAIELKESRFTNPARWYLSLIYLHENQTDKAINELNALVTTKSSYSSKASSLLEEL